MQGIGLIIAFVVAIVLMIVAISKWKVHPFLAIMTIALLLGLLAGIPLNNQVNEDGSTRLGIANVIGQGFSGTFTSIGIVIILGALIGTILEVTGAAFKLADVVVKVVGPKHPTLAIMLMGWIVSIPVFCDSGYVILNPIRKAMVRKTGVSSVAMTVALSAGLYASHVFIPPTPGPIAAANTLFSGVNQPVNLLLVMGLGALISVFALTGAYVYASFIGKRIQSDEEITTNEVHKTYEELKAEYGKIPTGWLSFAPIVVPIVLMALGSISAMAKWTGNLHNILSFLGTPIIALAVGTIFAVFLLVTTDNLSRFYKVTDDTLRVVGPILFVTAAGGVLGKVISESGMVAFITGNTAFLQTMGLF
ncbi:MAG: GntP family permease, partial [Clostridiales bacterium]|nr:GntP family permease [Clostridiales bacterium]